MKIQKIHIAFISLAVIGMVTLFSCEKKVYEIGEPVSKLEGINGSWSITGVTQIDEASPLKDEMDLSQYFIVPGEVALILSFNSADLTYEVIPGTGKNPFGDGGDWRFDDPAYPSTVNLYSNAGDTISMGLGQTIRPTDETLFLNQQKSCEGSPVTTYQYIFDRK